MLNLLTLAVNNLRIRYRLPAKVVRILRSLSSKYIPVIDYITIN